MWRLPVQCFSGYSISNADIKKYRDTSRNILRTTNIHTMIVYTSCCLYQCLIFRSVSLPTNSSYRAQTTCNGGYQYCPLATGTPFSFTSQMLKDKSNCKLHKNAQKIAAELDQADLSVWPFPQLSIMPGTQSNASILVETETCKKTLWRASICNLHINWNLSVSSFVAATTCASVLSQPAVLRADGTPAPAHAPDGAPATAAGKSTIATQG